MLKLIIEKARRDPFLRRALGRAKRAITGQRTAVFLSSAQYWNDRYKLGGNSGAGSHGRLADFKATFLNDFVKRHSVKSVIEFGCGDGAQLALADYPSYVGLDIAPIAVDTCRRKFVDSANYEFYETSFRHPNEGTFDLALSLDVIFHLVEDDVFDGYMRRLFSASSRYVIIYSYNFEREYASQHERGREFLKWCAEKARFWDLVKIVENAYPYDESDPKSTSQSDFFVFRKANDC